MKKYFLLLFLGITGTLNAQIELKVTQVQQETANWCVAAATRCVLSYNKIIVKQCKIMEYVRQKSSGYGGTDCCLDPVPNLPYPCDKGVVLGYSKELGSAWGILMNFSNNTLPSDVIPRRLDINEITVSLSLQRPPIIDFRFNNGTAHAAVLYAIDGNDVKIMNPEDYYLDKNWIDYNLVYDNGGRIWYGTLTPKGCLRDDPCDPLPPEDHCSNGRHDPGLGETGIDCGGPDCPECTLCNNCILDEGEDAMDCGGTCPPCKGSVPDELNITKTAQLTSEMKALKKITAGDATIVTSGKDVRFVTDKTGSIVLLPGFTAESGSKFTAQLKDLSEYKRRCGAICYNYTLPSRLTVPSDHLYIYNLFSAVQFNYTIYDSKGNAVYYNYLPINSDGDHDLWDCFIYDGYNIPSGKHDFKMDYWIYFCNSGYSYHASHNFSVNYVYEKSLIEESEKSEGLDTPQFSSSDHLKIQDKKNAPSLSIIPNPNPGTFQLETNFPLSNIGNLKITNLMGVTVYETQNVASNMVQLQNPAAGTFFVVMVLKDGAVITRKMVVQ